MAETEKQEKPNRRQKAVRRGRAGLGMITSLSVAALVFLALGLSISGRTIPVPERLRATVEERINERLAETPMSLGGMSFALGRDGVPQLFMSNIRLADLQGGAVVELNTIGAELSLGRLLRGEVAASNLALAGAQITFRRTADGDFAFRSDPGSEAESLPDLLQRIDRTLESRALATLEEVTASGIVLTLEDARSGRIWQATNAAAIVRKTPEALSLSITSDVFNGTDDIAQMQLSLSRNRDNGRVSIGVNVNEMPAADIALQSPVLSWLSVLDAPISGSVRAGIGAEGELLSLAGTLDISAGALQPGADIPPAEFDAARAYFVFDPARQRIDFSEIAFESDDGSLLASGHAYLSELEGPWPTAFLGQFRVDQLNYDGGGVFQGPVAFEDIRADLRLRLDPFTAELAQIYIDNEDTPVHASGLIEAREGGWHVSIDASSPRILSDRVLALWPVKVSPITRGWLGRNLKAGAVVNPSAAVRFHSGEKPEISLSFEVQDGTARFLPNMPELTGVFGKATMRDHSFTLHLERGGVTARNGEYIDAAGSVFSVPDVRPRPSWGDIRIVARGTLEGALTVLNNPPIRIMERANRPTDIAEAFSVANARIRLPLEENINNDALSYSVAAQLSEVRSDRLVEGRVFSASALELKADNDGIGVEGDARLDGLPLTANWRQPFGEAAAEGGRITGDVTLSPDGFETFGIPLPVGFASGSAQGQYDLRLPLDGPARLSVTSDLEGLMLAIPSLGWRKSASGEGSLAVDVALGDIPDVQTLMLSAPGLSLGGNLEFTEDGFQAANFQEVTVGDWLQTSVRLAPSAGGTTLSVNGGTVDLRQLDLDSGDSGGGSDYGPIAMQFDRVILSDSLSLTPFAGQIGPGPFGLSGEFEARVNGGTPVSGTLAPANAGTAIRVQSSDAAGVIRDAGLTPNAREGRLDVVLTPVAGAPGGTYDGQFLIEDVRLRKAPLMADLLDAISVVGLIDQLDGPGIKFETIDGRFRLSTRRLNLVQAAAVGGSLGISADGVYDFSSKALDIKGVISPVYFLNGIGSVLTRRGEGLFGFNYRMRGSVSDPRVGVNPLSIFTPGAFRQIFRRSPPQSQ